MASGVEMSDQLTEDPVLRMRSRFWRTTESAGEVLHVETWVDPGGGVTPHIHPAMDERFGYTEVVTERERALIRRCTDEYARPLGYSPAGNGQISDFRLWLRWLPADSRQWWKSSPAATIRMR